MGAGTLAIDVGCHSLLMYGHPETRDAVGRALAPTFGIEPFQAAFVALRIPGAVLSILSSYYWNRRWTFRAAGRQSQFFRFWVVSLSAMALNQLTSAFLQVTWQSSAPSAFIGAHLVAAGVATVFNFTGQRMWTFRAHARTDSAVCG